MTDNQIKCPGCGESAAQGTKFCAKCGAAIPEAPPEPKPNFCSSCGKSVDPGTTFCPGCGGKIGETKPAGGPKEVSFKLPEGITLPNRFEIIPGPILYAGGAATLLVLLSLVLPWYSLFFISVNLPCAWGFIFLIFTAAGAAMLVLKPSIHWVFLGVGGLGLLLCLAVSGSAISAATIGFYMNLLGQIAWLATFFLAHMEQKK